jgi:quinol monooxygenase YgiN
MYSGNMFSVYGRMTALPGRRDEVIALLHEGFRAGGDGSGLLTYSINAAFEDPDTIWLTQLWTDKEAHDATTRSEPVATVSQRLHPLLAQPPEGSYGHAVYVTWPNGRGTEPAAL